MLEVEVLCILDPALMEIYAGAIPGRSAELDAAIEDFRGGLVDYLCKLIRRYNRTQLRIFNVHFFV